MLPSVFLCLYLQVSTLANQTGQVYTSSDDSWGNVTSRTYSGTTSTLTYDLLDHFVSWNAGAQNKDLYVYDASGNRVLRRTTTSSSTTMTAYAFGVEEHSYFNTGGHKSDLYYYTLGGRLLGALDNSGKTTFYLSDALGSVLASFSSAAGIAAIKGNQVFGPYGNARDSQGTINTAKGFTGQYNDSLTGLDYYGSRYYDQVAGVFLSADIMQGNMQGMNPYAYVGGNPETKNDPSGQMFAPPGGGGGGPASSPIPTTSTATPWWQQGLNVLGTAVHTVATTAVSVADFVTGASSMISDVQTLFDSKTSLWQKVLAGGDLLLNATMDVMMLTGIGEGLRGAELLLKGGIDLAEHVGEDVLAHEGESTLAHVAECVGLSFAPATLVATARGEHAIGKLHVGDKVWAYNPKTHTMELEPVLHVWINHDNDLVDLTITSTTHAQHGQAATKTKEVIHTNKKHPFLTLERGFLAVGQITLGMHLVQANGRYGVVTGWELVPGASVMYNLEVAHDHTFTVGYGQWVVHNCGSNLPQVAEARAREISANIGSWSKSYLTVGTAMVEDNGGVRTLIATNEKASSGLINLVKAQLNPSEELVTLADNQGRHAEQVLVEYAKSNGLKILGLGASNNFCNEICGPMLIKEVGQEFLGQPWPQP